MFQLTYIARELRRRLGRTLLTASGLAAGVGLVIGIIGVSQGLDAAQAEVLAPLRSIGTDVLVTRVAGQISDETTDDDDSADDRPRAGRGPGGFFAAGPPGAQPNNDEDTAALLEENASLVTDLASLGEPGERFTRDFFLSATLLSFPEEAIDEVAALEGVTSVMPGLTLLAQHQTGTVPEIVAEIQTGGEEVTTTVRPDPMTAAEEKAFQSCLSDRGIEPRPDDGVDGDGGGGVVRPAGRGAFEECLPKRFREFEASVITPMRTIQQIVNPPTTDITTTSYTAAGIDPARPDAGLITTDQLVSGSWLSGAHDVLAAAGYADRTYVAPGSTIKINGKTFTVAGIVNPSLTGSTADLYFPLETLQKMASKEGRVTQVLVAVDDASRVDEVAAKIGEALPGAQVVTTQTLADQVTGSLTDAKNLAGRLGGALGVIVLGAAFIIAVLLTLGSIAKRVREIGTLRAIGWSRGRVVRQIVGETAGIGVIGGLLGIAIGLAVAFAVGALSPSLTATTAGVPGFGDSSLSGIFGLAGEAATTTTTLALRAPVTVVTMLLGVAFAVVGGLLAGTVGGWRAARLSPAEALRTVG